MPTTRYAFPVLTLLVLQTIIMVILLQNLGCDKQEQRVPRMNSPQAPTQIPYQVPAMPPQMSDKETTQMDPIERQMPPGMTGRKEKPVVVPDALKNRWKAVRMVLLEKASQKKSSYVVPLGRDFSLPRTGLTVRVDNLLPHFSMEGEVFTSKSDRMENPAAQVKIQQNNQEIFKGWMFIKFPNTHAFEHPKFALRVTEFVPAS